MSLRRPVLSVAATLVALALVLGACSSREPQSTKSDRLPDLTLAALEAGDPVRLSTLRGPLVINLWASWCGPCREELPRYAAFAKKYAGRVDVLGIDFQETRPAAAVKLAADTGVDYPLYADPDGKLRAIGLPKILLVDKDGRIAFEKYVEITSVGQLEQMVRTHLGVGE